jgi:hypothetical protein
LGGLLGAAAVAVVPPGTAGGVVLDPGAAIVARIARDWLARHPQEASPVRLARLVGLSAGAARRIARERVARPAEQAALSALRQRELGSGTHVVAGGLMLAPSEARLCALIHMLGAGGRAAGPA